MKNAFSLQSIQVLHTVNYNGCVSFLLCSILRMMLPSRVVEYQSGPRGKLTNKLPNLNYPIAADNEGVPISSLWRRENGIRFGEQRNERL